jgi:hypothetical protein
MQLQRDIVIEASRNLVSLVVGFFSRSEKLHVHLLWEKGYSVINRSQNLRASNMDDSHFPLILEEETSLEGGAILRRRELFK